MPTTCDGYFQWKRRDAVRAFFDSKEAQEKVLAEIGAYGPKPRIYNLVFGVNSGD